MVKLGIQIYSVRDEYAADPLACFKAVKSFGYTGAEMFGSAKTHKAQEIKSWLEEAGLEICGFHTSAGEIREDIDGIVEYNRILGNRFVEMLRGSRYYQADYNTLQLYNEGKTEYLLFRPQ